ncbi:MAG: DoxX family protein [Verrucomicrobiae bacterium]|nr:DoxX family protein [Verrucomicrobiae bacterium]
MNLVAGACRWVVGAVFLIAGVLKAIDPAGFMRDIDGYRMVDGPLLVAVVFFVPWLEIAAGAGLVLKRPYGGAALAAIGMLVVFLFALVQAWARGLDISCGCFGSGPTVANYPWWVARDVAMLLACGACWMDSVRDFGRPA